MSTIVIVDHEGTRTTVNLEETRRYSLGRSPRNDLALTDPMLSRLHAELYRSDGGSWVIEDQGSVNGVLVNGHKVETSSDLSDGDRVVLGGCVLRFLAEPPGERVQLSDVPITGMTMQIAPDEVRSTFERTEPGTGADLREELETLRRRFQVIERAHLALAAHVPLEDVLPRVLDLVFEAVEPDRAAVLLREPTGEIECRAFRGDQGAEMSIPRTLARTVVDQRVSLLTEDAQKDSRFDRSESIGIQGVHAAMAVPLWTEREVSGLIYADSQGYRRFSEEDLKILTMLANVAAMQMENHALFDAQVRARRIQEEARTAAEIQRRLLPAEPPVIPGYVFAGFNDPCHEVGGDYYGCISLDGGRHVLGLGDVAGKGIAAALVMAVLQATVQTAMQTSPELMELLGGINRAVARSAPANRFVTMFVMELDSGTHRLRSANAGHAPAPVLVRRNGELRRFRASGPPLGPSPEFEYQHEEATLEPGDFLFACSDGVTEAMSPDARILGEDRLEELLVTLAGRSPEVVHERVLAAVEEHCAGDPAADDLTMMTLQRSPGH